MANPAVAQYEWHADWGLTLSRPFVWKDAAGDPIDVTSMEATLTIRRAYSSAPVLIATSDPANGITMGTTNGRIDVLVPGADMEIGSRSADQEFVYDIVVDDSGTLTKLVEGDFILHSTAYED